MSDQGKEEGYTISINALRMSTSHRNNPTCPLQPTTTKTLSPTQEECPQYELHPGSPENLPSPGRSSWSRDVV